MNFPLLEHHPLEQGLRQLRLSMLAYSLRILREHHPLEQGLRRPEAGVETESLHDSESIIH